MLTAWHWARFLRYCRKFPTNSCKPNKVKTQFMSKCDGCECCGAIITSQYHSQVALVGRESFCFFPQFYSTVMWYCIFRWNSSFRIYPSTPVSSAPWKNDFTAFSFHYAKNSSNFSTIGGNSSKPSVGIWAEFDVCARMFWGCAVSALLLQYFSPSIAFKRILIGWIRNNMLLRFASMRKGNAYTVQIHTHGCLSRAQCVPLSSHPTERKDKQNHLIFSVPYCVRSIDLNAMQFNCFEWEIF